MSFPCQRLPESGLVIVSVFIDHKYRFKMVFDTGASNTTLDSNALYLANYQLKDSIGVVPIETANGVIETNVYEVEQFSALGLVWENFQVQVCDFLAHGILPDYNGMLGMDFLQGTKFCLDTEANEITIQQK